MRQLELLKIVAIVSIVYVDNNVGQIFVPEYCDWPTFPSLPCTRIQFSPAGANGADYRLQWQLWSAISSPPSYNEPFVSANYFRYVTTNGALDMGLTARTQTDYMQTVETPAASITPVICLRFYYYISTSSNQLAIFLVENSTTMVSTKLVWSVPTTNAAVASWNRAYVATNLTNWSNSFRIQIEATSTGLQRADTAISRLSVTFGQSCFDLMEEDIIPTTYTPAPYWSSASWSSYSNPVYYTFDSTFSSSYSTQLSNLLTNSITSLMQSIFESSAPCASALSFSRSSSPTAPYLNFVREFSSGKSIVCAAMVGPFVGVATEIHLTDTCFTAANNKTLLLHAIAHALGLKHEHRRSDRLTALILNDYAYDPIFQPFFAVDNSMKISETAYDLSSVTQVGPSFLDQTGGRSPYGVLTSIDGYRFGAAEAFSHYDLLKLANLLGGPNAMCALRRIGRCSALCFNGGLCSRRPTSSDNGACLCRSGFTGTSCNVMSCFPPCQNGFCDPGNVCNCASVSSLWTGYRCHIPVTAVCSSIKCANGGTCIVTNGQQSCICQPGYTGLTCSTVICEQCKTACPTSTVCISPNRVNCTTGTRGASCETCATGYIGNSITGCKPYCSNNCSGNGVCSAPEKCTCNTGWTGSRCHSCISGYEYICYGTTTVVPTCYPPCSAYGGYCSSQGYCACYEGFEGLTCDRMSFTSTTPVITKTSTTITTPYNPTTTELIRCNPKQLPNLASNQLYVRYLLSPYEINYQVLTTGGDVISNERQSLEDFLNRALREELNRFTDGRFMRLAVVNVCPGVVVDVVVSYFGDLNMTTVSRIIVQQARAIGVPLTDGKTALSRLDFDYILQSQLAAVSVELCTVYNDLSACKNGATCVPVTTGNTSHTATFSPLMSSSSQSSPLCQCTEGYYGEFCADAELPIPIWACVAIAVGGILLIVFATVTVHMVCGTGRRRHHRQHRYHRSHPFPPPPRPMPGYVMAPYLHTHHPGTLPHPGGAPYNIPVPLPQPVHQPPPQVSSVVNANIDEPPPPYHHICFPGRPNNMLPPGMGPTTGTIPRSQIRADDIDNDFSNLPPPPGYAPPSNQLTLMPPPPHPRTSTADTRNRQMKMKRPKLGR